MPTITVEYQEVRGFVEGAPVVRRLGAEHYDDIEEAVVPLIADHETFCVKKFAQSAQRRWRVDGVRQTSNAGAVPVAFEVRLYPASSEVPEEYLSETLASQPRVKAPQFLFQGALVEVDFGHIQSIGSAGGFGNIAGYHDTLQHGEMHKRRLAIVNTVDLGAVQVIPVSSVERAEDDKTSFMIETDLSHLVTYGNGKPSWAVCRMVQTVSFTRILPPLTRFFGRQLLKHGRNTRYTLKLSADDKRALRTAMAHAAAIADYDVLVKKALELEEAKTQIAELQAANQASEQGLRRLKHLEEVAADLGELDSLNELVDERVKAEGTRTP